MKRKKILLLGTGGTITAKMIDGTLKPGEYSERELLEFIPEIDSIAEIKAINLYNIDSVCMQPGYWVEIAQTIKENYESFDGFVITHGTDTMHYTASALSFLIQNLDKPIALTGSMIPPHELGTDARQNVIDAVRLATESDIHEVCIVFNRKIFRGNRTKKFREIEYNAYQSIGMLPLGIIENKIRYSGEKYRTNHSIPTNDGLKRKLKVYDNMELGVCIQKITPGYNPKIISKLIEIGYKGIITEGFGSGNIPIDENSLIEEIKKATDKGIPIIVCSQCSIGFSWGGLYESGKKALEAGAIPGYDMISESAMTKLMWILGNHPGLKIDDIRELFLKDIAGEMSSNQDPSRKKTWEYAF